ncbi:RNA polymerase sigma-70 factor (ECF subfamily) [Thiogranum longum]|uniref:RNA polymerase sigma-70 factor (ECF subfamily) n=1 Tax=Thiogranum longum TaxID=1537524 RepID=A0A4R1HBZ6_9GAMM|nr:RNA polymerase sigma factor [Thiogranum longum]TCK17710.1 RNA polymerase sigma-70 factor (ECF subfamily) [Thiogranum longum]
MRESVAEFSGADRASWLSAPDEVAIERVRGGDAQAYEIIMRRYNQRLYRVARSILRDDDAAQDAVQEAYVSAFYKLEHYAPTGSFAAWLTRIAVNEALMIKRKDRKYEKHSSSMNMEDHQSDDQMAASRTDPASVAANGELGLLLEAAVDQLPADFRTVFVLRAIQQLNVRETSESLGIKEATVKTRYHRARGLMQEILNQYMEAAGLQVYEFAGKRCDAMVMNVLNRLAMSAVQG